MNYRLLSAFLSLSLAANMASAQDEGTGSSGFLSISAAYSERYKDTLGATVSIRDLLGNPVDVSLTAQRNSLGYQWGASIGLRAAESASLPSGTGFTVGYEGYEFNWENSAFDTERQGIFFQNSFRLGDDARLRVRGDVYKDLIRNVNVNTSPLVVAEEGRVDSGGVTIGYTFDTRTGGLIPRQGFLLGADFQYFGFIGDAKWHGLSVRAEGYIPVTDQFYISALASAGGANGRPGYDLRITERAFLGYLQPRGFAYGGIGPVDDNGTQKTFLGGERFATASFALNFDAYETASSVYTLSVFADMGSVWQLANTTGGFLAEINDRFHMRRSIGVGLKMKTRVGSFELNYASPVQKRPLDEVQEASFAFTTTF